MKRRDLLRLRVASGHATVELPCERLFMHYVDARRATGPPGAPSDPTFGEPDAVHDVPGTRDLFDGLARELESAEVVRVVGREWLADVELREAVDRLLASFVARGGRVESA